MKYIIIQSIDAIREKFAIFGDLERIYISKDENGDLASVTFKDSRSAYLALLHFEICAQRDYYDS